LKKIATDIKTDDWNRIIQGLIEEKWKVVKKYDAFDAGIDFDFIELAKNGEKIQFGWSNWEEGEIKCSVELIETLQKKFSISFKFGKPMNLKPSVVRLTKFQIWINKIKKWGMN